LGFSGGILWGKSAGAHLTHVCDFVSVLNSTFYGALKGPLFDDFFREPNKLEVNL
jgi:hypothetical protein